jgi:small-conductance mechanosensitive channel
LFTAPAATLILTLIVAVLVRRILFRSLDRWASRTTTKLDNELIQGLRTPFLLWSLILGIQLSLQVSKLPDRALQVSGKVLLGLWIVSLTMVASKVAAGIVRQYGARVSGAQSVTSLTQNVVRLLVVSLGILLILNELGVSITPILTALGVGGLAVALALQDTLSNLFSGFYISIAGQIRVGDYIKLDTGQEGYVTDISWRSTSIRVLANNLVFVPNAKIAQAIVTNFHLPETRMSLLISIGVTYDSDPDHVERVLIEEAKSAAGEIPGLLAEPAPFVRFIPGFGDFSLDFTLICQVKEFVDQYLVQHELRKRIFKRFRREGIRIPFPTRTLVFENSPEQLSVSPKTAVAAQSPRNGD